MIALLALLACSSDGVAPVALETPTPPDGELLRVRVTPTRTDEDGNGAAPMSVLAPDLERPLTIDLERTFLLPGSVEGSRPTPTYRASVPGADGPIRATVHLRPPASDLPADVGVQAVRTASDAEGLFEARVVQGPYDLTLVPDDPALAIARIAVDPTPGSVLDLQLEPGVPVYGRVLAEGSPKVGALVRAVTPDGIEGPPTATDSGGWYQLTVPPGLWAVSTAGLGDGFDPVLTTPVEAVGPSGARRDFTYARRVLHDVSARVIGPDGDGVAGVDFRLRSLSLDDYDVPAQVEITGNADSRGNIVTRAIAGTWVLEVLPDRDTPMAGLRQEVVVVEDQALGALELDGLVELVGFAPDASGLGVVDAQVSCAETGLRGRTWTTFTDLIGRFSLDVPPGELTCVLAPPPSRVDLALTRVTLSAGPDRVSAPMLSGAPVGGVVTVEGEAEPNALVEIQDADGRVWASALTDGRGEFSTRIVWPQPDPAADTGG